MRNTVWRAARHTLRHTVVAAGILAMPGAFLGISSPAHAALTLTATAADSSTITVVDGGAGDADGLVNGEIELATTTFGGFRVLGSFHSSNANFASAAGPLDTTIGVGALNSGSSTVLNTLGTTNSVTVQLSDTNYGDFHTPAVAVTTTASGTFNNVAGTDSSSVDSNFYIDNTNTLFGMAALARHFLGTANGDSISSYSDPVGGGSFKAGNFPVSGLFSMTETFTITLSGGTALTSRGNNMTATPVVPEPGTLVMLACAVPVVGIGALRRRRKAQD